MLVEQLLAALGVGRQEWRVVVGEDQLHQPDIVEERLAVRDVQHVDAGRGAITAVELEFQLRPIGPAPADRLGLESRAVEIEAGFAADRVRFHPAGETISRVGFQRDVGVEAGVGVTGGRNAYALPAAVKAVRVRGDRPLRRLVGFAVAVVAPFPALGQAVAADDFEARVREEIRAFAIHGGAVNPAQYPGCLAEPLVGLVGGVAHDAGDDGLYRSGLGKLGELHQRGELGERVRVADHGRGKEQRHGGGVAAEGADGVAADSGVRVE